MLFVYSLLSLLLIQFNFENVSAKLFYIEVKYPLLVIFKDFFSLVLAIIKNIKVLTF
jgi:hypothetical protein